MLPNFLLIGAMKSGTTSLYEYLRGHPQVLMSTKKELDFFIDGPGLDGRLSWYEEQFAPATVASVAVGEASTSYTKHPLFRDVPANIASVIPDVRLIYLVRHPIERMRSQYLHEVLLGEQHLPVETALLCDSRYRDFSSYAMQISAYMEFFPREQLLVIQAEHLLDRRFEVAQQVCEFLGLSPFSTSLELDKEHHQTSEKRVPIPVLRRIIQTSAYRRASPWIPARVKRFGRRRLDRGVSPHLGEISDAVRDRLEDMIRDDVRALRSFMGPGFDDWGIR
jgi:hypothetical protein